MNRLVRNSLARAGLACVLDAMALPQAALAADLALVIGNRDYRKAPDAVSAEADARAVAAALTDAGYEVILGIDQTRREMERRLTEFRDRLGQAERVVVFYSGHALRSEGTTYVAPIEQGNETLVATVMGGVPLSLVLRLAASKPGKAVVFLDVAQLEGFAPRRFAEPGMAEFDPGSRLLVVSAAAPGRALRGRSAEGTPFANDVVRSFLEPGRKALEVARGLRTPAWVAGGTDAELVLAPPGRGPIAGGGGTGAPALTDAQIEDALRLTNAQRREVQESLSLLGHDPRGIDGVFGPGTRTAIRLWQRSNNLTETGYLTAEQLTRLRDEATTAGRPGSGATTAEAQRDHDFWARTGALATGDGYRAYLERYSEGLHAGEARSALRRMAERGTDFAAAQEYALWRDVQRYDRAVDYRDYLRRYPAGIWKPEAEERIAALEGRPVGTGAPEDAAAAEAALGLTRTDRLSVEQRLAYLGFAPGAQDGFFDATTRWAIEGYQKSRGYAATGYLDRPTVTGIMDETRHVRSGVVIDGAQILLDLLGGLQ